MTTIEVMALAALAALAVTSLAGLSELLVLEAKIDELLRQDGTNDKPKRIVRLGRDSDLTV